MLDTWTKTPTGFCTEASSLGLKPGQSVAEAVLPDGTKVPYYAWLSLYHEGEVTHWRCTKGGVVYEVFND